ncbi:MAG: hypothetical protein JXA42_22020 [Anaerolineales bacterium]|nr:hypothetical protein [Anaerolineales bacterium]
MAHYSLLTCLKKLAQDAWERMGGQYSIHQQQWPAWDPSLVRDETHEIVVQVDGKKRDRIIAPSGASKDNVRTLALASPKASRHLKGRRVISVVVIPGRVVNFVTESVD